MKRAVKMTGTTGLWICSLFFAAGRWNWARGWIFVALYIAGMGAMGALVKRAQPDLLGAREKWRRKDTKGFDKIFLAIFLPLCMVQPVVGALDVERFHWSEMPDWALWAGIALLVPAFVLMGWSMAVNRHAETTVRIQTDREHTVVETGPYQFVRHPMYVGAMLLYAGSALVLGSFWALATAGLIAAALVVRTALEDRVLRRELPGYEDFTSRTRYRLVPGIW